MTASTRDRLAAVILAGCLVLEVFVYYSSSFTIVDPDPFVMGEVARRVAEGEVLYREAWDNKPPLSLLFYLPSQFFAPMSYLGQQLFGALWTAILSLVAFTLLRGESTLVRSVAASLTLVLPLSRSEFVWASSEDAVNLFALALTFIAYRIARRGTWLNWELPLTGALAVVAFHCRQTGILFAIPVGMLVLFGPHRLVEKVRGVAAIAAGAGAGIAITLAIVLPLSDFSSYFYSVFVGPQRFVGDRVTQVRQVVRDQLLEVRHHPYLLIGIFAVLAAAGRWERLVLIAVAAVSGLAVLGPMGPWSHYQEQLIPLLVLSAVIAVRRLEGVSRSAAAAYAAALVGFFAFNGVVTGRLLHDDQGVMAEADAVVRVIEAENAQTPGRLLAVGRNSAYIYYRTRVTPVHKYHWDFFFDSGDFLPESPADVVKDIIQRPPTWLVVAVPTFARYRESPGETHLGQLVYALCGARLCDTVARTQNWHVLRVH